MQGTPPPQPPNLCVFLFFFVCVSKSGTQRIACPMRAGLRADWWGVRFFEGVFGEFYCFLRWMDREGDGDTGSFGFCGGIGGG